MRVIVWKLHIPAGIALQSQHLERGVDQNTNQSKFGQTGKCSHNRGAQYKIKGGKNMKLSDQHKVSIVVGVCLFGLVVVLKNVLLVVATSYMLETLYAIGSGTQYI